MAHKGHLSRAQLRLREPRSRSTSITPARGGVTRHYGGGPARIDTSPAGHGRCESVWRDWQAYHMDRRGWADVAYTAGYCQHGYSFAGRGLGVRTAANGTDAGNQSWYAFTFIGGGDEVPTADALDALDWLVAQARAAGAGDGFNSHSDHKPTDCAGDFLRRYQLGERDGATPVAPSVPATPAPAPPPAPAPTPPVPTGDLIAMLPTLRYGDQGGAVRRLQGLLLSHNYNVGGAGIDGDNGANTNSATVRFCKAKGLLSGSTAADTRVVVGPRTWTELVKP